MSAVLERTDCVTESAQKLLVCLNEILPKIYGRGLLPEAHQLREMRQLVHGMAAAEPALSVGTQDLASMRDALVARLVTELPLAERGLDADCAIHETLLAVEAFVLRGWEVLDARQAGRDQ